MKERPFVSVVIPNWNGREHLRGCLTSLANQRVRPSETLLVDNGSTDDSVEIVRTEFPWVTLVLLPENLGFAPAVNKGISMAQGEYIALLNNDTEVDADWLSQLVDALQTEREAGSAACKMLDFHDRTLIDGAGDGLTRSGAPLTRGYGEPDGPRFNRCEYVFGACAGAALYRKSLFDEAGLFDEDFRSYFEDADLAYRSQLLGLRCLYVPTAICFHKRGATGGRATSYPIRMQERNLLGLYVKNLPWALFLRLLPVIAVARVRHLFRAIGIGVGGAVLKGWIQGIGLIPTMVRKRGNIQHRRKVSARYLAGFMGKK